MLHFELETAFLFIAVLCFSLGTGLSATAADRTGAVAPDGSIKDTVLSTLYYTPDIKAFQEYRQAAEHDLSRARSGWLPRLDARAGWGYEQWSNQATRQPAHPRRGTDGQNDREFYERSEASLVLQQTIWDGLATWSRYQIGVTRLDSATSRLLDNSEASVLDALLAHLEVYRQRRLVALSELNVQNHKDILGSQVERQRLGASSVADVTQTRGRLARAQASLVETQSALEIAMAQYKRLAGKDPGELEAPYLPENPYPSLEAVLSDSQTKNPKVKALQSDVETAKAQIKLDKSTYHPQIYLEAGPTYNWQVQGSTTYEWGTGIMLRASWNLFNGFYDYYNVKGDAARMRQAREQLNSQTNNLAQETAATWSSLISAQEQSKFFEVAVENSTMTRDAYLQQFNVGQRSLLDVLDSENELYSFSIQLVTSKLNEVAAQYKLKALGGELIPSMGFDPSLLNVNTDDYARAKDVYHVNLPH
ncbi:Type I secretion outer membrane protein, TolC family [uncultured delta proteobacterium]|uniref:Type I secretion outer membrane protein, TolC family n=1 Tax=uncultured delta proteobacterium TaxID=34034 RepID=A0A212KEF9_9DELT|nr:Type I secretion outer membrane protein, TolC family [uncultured delta proteobacterium]